MMKFVQANAGALAATAARANARFLKIRFIMIPKLSFSGYADARLTVRFDKPKLGKIAVMQKFWDARMTVSVSLSLYLQDTSP